MSKSSTALTKSTAAALVAGQMPEFAAARKHVEAIRTLGRRTVHESILLGQELYRLHKDYGAPRGGDRKTNVDADKQIPWKQLVAEQTGLSFDTCNRCINLALAAKKHIPLLTAEDVLTTPFSDLPEQRQTELVKAIEKAADGRSMTQLMLDFGAWKDKTPKGPPKATAESAAKRRANAEDEALTTKQLQELSEDHIESIEKITLAAAFRAMDTERLSVLENVTSALLQAVAAELKDRKKGGRK